MLAKLKIVHLLILFESLMIGYSLSLMDGLEIMGYFPAGLYFILSFTSNRRLNHLLFIYGLAMAFPRLLILQESILHTKANKIVLEQPYLEDCRSYSRWSTKEISECQNRNREAAELAKSNNDQKIQDARQLNLLDWSNIFLYIITSALLPFSIFFLQTEQTLGITKEENFKNLYSQKLPREEIQKKLKISQSTYYRLASQLKEETNE